MSVAEDKAVGAGEGQQSKEQFRDFFKTYNKMSETCFNQCVWDFGTESVRNREDRCVMRCVQHYMDSTKKIGECFAENYIPATQP